ncbi:MULTISPECIES: glycerate kinase [Streptomyces]|uniref:Glycerate kinase n=1 Tax=Streptomyces koelreuteriae TaxID=2838015 RepID=A0ABX8FN61_9ACTN|nr:MULTISPECIES: glycerate kinase [Streptomyces]QWB22544.1 glycerate kinase [Streptomyces koelreuteriae]UUA05490.1 glycerate kinase [Streptomyces koelreuteriae]UUA13116.1 glycerate kinase [Streptomyces sp. CRCS-T-1]
MASVLIAPDKFKGSLSADEVARALERGLLEAAPDTRVDRLPLADGGEGSVAAACAGRFRREDLVVTGPTGQPLTAGVAIHGRTVLIEAAAVCGLGVLPGGRKAPLTATSQGVGEAVRYALEGAADTIVLALGGVATTDGGAGLLRSLGAVLARADGTPIGPGGGGLADLRTADLTEARTALKDIDLVLATDVDNPLLGPTGAAAVYGPQKGASAAEVRELDDALAGFVRRLAATGDPDAARGAETPGAGAAGGLGYAGMLLGGRVCSGADYFLTLLGADELLAASDFVVTGEGSLDEQSLSGKLPVALARRARRYGTEVHAVAGRCTLPAERTAAHFRSVQALTDLTDQDCAHDSDLSARLLERCGRALAERRLIGKGRETAETAR